MFIFYSLDSTFSPSWVQYLYRNSISTVAHAVLFICLSNSRILVVNPAVSFVLLYDGPCALTGGSARRHQQNITKLKHDNIYTPSVCETSAGFDPSHYCCCLSSEWKVPNLPAGTGLTNINPAHANMDWYWKNWDEGLILVQNKLNKPRDIYGRMFSPLLWYISVLHLIYFFSFPVVYFLLLSLIL